MIFNVGAVEVIHPERIFGGERWVQLWCHYAGDDSPLIVQMPEKAWMEMLATEKRSPCTLENCGHMRQLDAIVDLLGMKRGTRSVLDELSASPFIEWGEREDEVSRLRVQVDELTAQRDAFGQKAHRLQEEVLRVRSLIDRDRTGLAEAVERMVKEAGSRMWITESRGPYAWDDEKYKAEVGIALRAVIEIGKKALNASGDNADSVFRPEAPKVVMWGDRKMKEGRCPPDHACLACDRLGKHLEPAD